MRGLLGDQTIAGLLGLSTKALFALICDRQCPSVSPSGCPSGLLQVALQVALQLANPIHTDIEDAAKLGV